MHRDWGQLLLMDVEMEFLLWGSACGGRLELLASSQEGRIWCWDGTVMESAGSCT